MKNPTWRRIRYTGKMKKIAILLCAAVLLIVGGMYFRAVIRATVEQRDASQRYLVSLGDSVAAGVGLSGERNQRDSCDTSTAAAAIIVAKGLNARLEQFACSGATVAAVNANAKNNVVTQLVTAQSFIGGNDVLITAGANDVDWLGILRGCATASCATDQNRQMIAASLQKLEKSYADVLQQIRSFRPHRLLVHTYYDLVRPTDICTAEYGITPEEVAFIIEETTALNDTISKAADGSGATIIPIDFSGHLLCDSDSWLQGIDEPAPLHPTAAGQAHIAELDIAILKAR
jgi:lysophospholipase L1-like esterase